MILSGSFDGTARFSEAPTAWPESAEAIGLRVQLITGRRLDSGGAAMPLSPSDWLECRRRLRELGEGRSP